MSVFDADSTTQTELATDLGANDYGLRKLGALVLSDITSPTALPPTNGIDCKSVHGRRDQQIYGDMHEQIDGNLTTTIDQDETHTVIGTVHLTVVHGWHEEQQGPVNRHYAQKVTDVFDDDHDSEVPDSMAFAVSNYSNTFVWETQIGVCAGLAATISLLISLTLASVDLEGKLLFVEYDLFNGAGMGIKLFEIEAKVDVAALVAEIRAEMAARASVAAGVHLGVYI